MPLEVVQEDLDFERLLPQEDYRQAGRQAAPRPPQTPRETMAALEAVASVLTVRVVLALAVIGAFALAVLVVFFPSPQALWALGLFSAIVVPLTWLSQKAVR